PRFAFVPGGIAVSFPISHSPTQNERVLARIDRTPSRLYVTCGERELRFGMHWSVEYSLGAGDDFLTQRAVFHNPGHAPYPWLCLGGGVGGGTGMERWSWGAGGDRAWATWGAAHREPYVEIQGGPLDDQATKAMLEPNETRSHVEFWLPSDKALDIDALRVPDA